MGGMRQCSPGNLPERLSSFVDRRTEAREVKTLLEQARLVTITGPGGVGKTRLALQVADGVRRAMPDGAWLADMSSVQDPVLVPQAVATALTIHYHGALHPLDVLAHHLRTSRLLVVLDNCEHVLSGCQDLVSALLPRCPGVRILATSRHRLESEGEHLFVLWPLPVPGPGQSDAAANPVVQLFYDRAAAVLPGSTLTQSDTATVVELCRRTEGIPLAVELAAVRLRSLTATQLLSGLEQRFSTLSRGSAGAPERQRTLRAVFDWSFDLCTPQERALWMRSSVFHGGFDLDSAAAVCTDRDLGAEDLADVIAGLVDKSVLHTDMTGTTARYWMLETLLEHGGELLRKSAEPEQWQDRHRDWCAALVTRAARESFGPLERLWSARLPTEHPNIRAALASSLAGPRQAETGLRIAAGLRFYWFQSGLLSEGRRWLAKLLHQAPATCPARVAALEVAAYLSILQGEPEIAAPYLEEARALGHQFDDTEGLVKVAYTQGLSCMLTDRWDEAVPLFMESLRLDPTDGESPSVMTA
ncbi:ATP-binding protein, partial [Streptomyces antibioticus]|uniref:ATP-binding protein n=1 Tax=Streptomyces antibioticus TaxID=1890 RepID=UPI00346FB5CE